jgi:hypothetical protein
MAGANILIAYASSSSDNVTVSPRSAVGHVPPQYNPDAQVSFLAGTGIQNGRMTVNIRCDSCIDWNEGVLNPDSSSSRWIWAYKEGPPMNSDDTSAEIDFHDDFGRVIIDLTKAKSTSSSDSGPFLNYSPTAVSTSDAVSLVGDDNSSDKSHGDAMIIIAHGSLMAIAFVILLPVFALMVPLPLRISAAKVHAPLQGIALAMTIAGMGLGIKLGVDRGVMNDAHPIIGLVAIALLVGFLPAMGWLQHMHFRRSGGKSVFAYLHRWLGRCLITLGIINGGLGFRLAGLGGHGPPRSVPIAYSAIAGSLFLIYVAVQVAVSLHRRRRSRAEIHNEQSTPSGDSHEPYTMSKQDMKL